LIDDSIVIVRLQAAPHSPPAFSRRVPTPMKVWGECGTGR